MEERTRKPFFFEGRKRTKILTFLICFVIAALFWIFNALSHDYTSVIKFPVQLVYNKNKFVLLDKPAQKIDVKVNGYGWNILAANFGFQSTPLTLTPQQLTRNKYILQSDFIQKIEEILYPLRVEHVFGDTIYFAIEPIFRKKITLVPLTMDSRQTREADLFLEPSELFVTGPKAEVVLLKDTIGIEIPVSTGKKTDVSLAIPIRTSKFCQLSVQAVRVKSKPAH